MGPVTCHPAFERYADLCRAYSPGRVEEITGVPAAQIVETARLLWERRPVSYFHWTGLEQHTNATQSVRAISLLYALTGSFDVPGGNLRVSRPAVNDPGGRGLVSEAERAKTLGFAERPLGPGRHGWVTARDVYRAILQGTPYPIRGLIGFGGNTLLSQPDAALGRAALAKLDFLVVADLFMTPSAELADVVLPVASAWEREGLRAAFGPTPEGEAHVQLRAPVVAPRGESRSDTWIACELAKRLGLGDEFFGGDEDAGHRFVLAPSGVTLEELRANPGGVRVPLETRYRKYAEPGAGFPTPSGRVEIYAQRFLDHGQTPLPEYIEPAASPTSRPDLAARYPLVLTSAKVVQFCHSQPSAIITPASPSARAPSVPGRTRSHWSARFARPARLGSTTISVAPRDFAWAAAVAWARKETDGLWPHRRRHPVRAKSGTPMSTPKVKAVP
jgi:anaerobic selenocysteine-containing dehydrogenase